MQQQSISLAGCVANTWPLAWERHAVAQRYGVSVRPDVFTDIADSVHAETIRRVADARIAGGYPDGSFGPAAAFERGQMASFLSVTSGRGLFPERRGRLRRRGPTASTDHVGRRRQPGIQPSPARTLGCFTFHMEGVPSRDAKEDACTSANPPAR